MIYLPNEEVNRPTKMPERGWSAAGAIIGLLFLALTLTYVAVVVFSGRQESWRNKGEKGVLSRSRRKNNGLSRNTKERLGIAGVTHSDHRHRDHRHHPPHPLPARNRQHPPIAPQPKEETPLAGIKLGFAKKQITNQQKRVFFSAC